MEIDISRCGMTGLLYVNEVPFTQERIKMVNDIMSYANENKNQFEHSITIKDTVRGENKEGVVTIDKTNYNDFIQGVNEYKTSDISSDEDFN